MVFYHHHSDLEKAKLKEDNLAYISYISDNIASFSDRRKKSEDKPIFNPKMNLESIFNNLNGNNAQGKYNPFMLEDNAIIYPRVDPVSFESNFYGEVLDRIKDNLKNMDNTKEFLQSYLQVLEATLSFVPSSTNEKEYSDISLYDHVKLSSAYGAVIYDYLKFKKINNYKTSLFIEREKFYEEKAFLVLALDMSGIQNFIYQIVKENALKSLRARSFYLEILLEVIIDEILDRLNLIRCNLLYSGGGKAYLILSNTSEVKDKLNEIQKEVNKWLMDEFGIDLYLAMAYVETNANSFRDKPEGSYVEIFKKLSQEISLQKLKKYSYEEIQYLNSKMLPDGDRECKNCNRTDSLNEDNICTICEGIIRVSKRIFKEKYFMISKEQIANKDGLPLPFAYYLYPIDEKDLRQRIKNDNNYIRFYSKNEFHTGKKLSTNLWVGDYNYEKLNEKLSRGIGINRLGVLRADVDNLGQTFIKGFESSKNLSSLSRTATLSRMLSIFFKSNINYILENGKYSILEKTQGKIKRKCNIIYSGGDDVFLIGNWADVIGFAVDLSESLKKFSENSITLSAGVGIYNPTYPVSNMAEETGALESSAKEYIGQDGEQKNAICLFEKAMCFSWDEFTRKVVEEKLKLIRKFINILYKDDKKSGSSILYRVLSYLRNMEDKINFPRLLYLLSRKEAKNIEEEEIQKEFLDKIYDWAKNKKDRKQLEMAIILYIFENRGE